VLPHLLIQALLILQLGSTLPADEASRAAAAVGSPLERTTENAREAVRASERRVAVIEAQKERVRVDYQAQLLEIDRLKRQPASWRRDRQVRAKMAESLKTARDLRSHERTLQTASRRLEARRAALLEVIEAELVASPPRARHRELIALRREVRRALRPPARPIVLPDLEIDPLADPEELEHQAALIAQSEDELADELAHLEVQAARFERMARLREQRRRAAQLGALDAEGPRRLTGRAGAESASEAIGDAPSPPTEGGGDDGGGRGSEDFRGDPVYVLSEIVDDATLAALRRAERSDDPVLKAQAARRARAEVQARLERLEVRRREIEARARELERPSR
jgi:hypothetical protein